MTHHVRGTRRIGLSRTGPAGGRAVTPAAAALVLAALLAAAAGGAAGRAQTPAPIAYTVRFPAPATHYAEVEAVVPTDGRPAVELMMAVWTPGSYLVREYARHVERVDAAAPDGRPLDVARSAKNRWRITTGGAPRVTVTYRVYGREMSVRTNWIDAGFALLNGAPTFLTLADDPAPRPHEVRIVPAPGWRDTATALPAAPDGRPHHYRAADFDTLVDSPIVAGAPAVYPFTVAGTPHALVTLGEGGVWDGPAAAADVARVVEAQHRLWGFLPYDRFLFLNLLVEAGGGLEHRESTLLMTSRWTMRDRRRYLRWLGTVSHEAFHAWNGKRLRPAALGPFDYEREVLTPSLWMVEGLTTYYGPLLVHRAGLSSRTEYLRALSDDIATLQTTPGRRAQTVADASFDAWIKYYRRDENSLNVTVSYYTKGAVIGFLLDARIRAATGGRRSLDDVLRAAYARYAAEQGFRPGEFEAVASDLAGVDLGDWFDHAIRSTAELDYRPALAWFGLEFAADEGEADGAGGEAAAAARGDRDAAAGGAAGPGGGAPDGGDDTPAWLGLDTRNEGGRLVVARVRRETPAHEAGFNVGDEILAIDDYRTPPDGWRARLALYRPGDAVSVLVARRERLTRLDARFGARPADRWRLQPVETPTRAQTRRLDDWLGPALDPGPGPDLGDP